jgi:hypothetical protein
MTTQLPLIDRARRSMTPTLSSTASLFRRRRQPQASQVRRLRFGARRMQAARQLFEA